MKRYILPLFAMLLCMTACQKDGDGILTLKMESYSSDAKVHLDSDHYAVWDNDDPIWLNGDEKTVSVDGTTATISGVTGDGPWTAIYPYSWAESAASITYPATQHYRATGIDAPMAGYCAAGENILRFRNLGSILAVNVVNDSNAAMKVLTIEVTDLATTPNNLSGTATISGLDSDNPSATIASGSNTVTLDCGTGVTIAANSSHTFYIALPAISGAKLQITVKDDSYTYTLAQSSAATAFARNSEHLVSFSTSSITPVQYAPLPNQIWYTSTLNNSRICITKISPAAVDDQLVGMYRVKTFLDTIISISAEAAKESPSSTGLRTVTLPATVTAIADGAFDGCVQLTTATMPGVTTIGSHAFNSCSRLSDVNMPGVTTIGGYAFDGCARLSSITISNSVTSIGEYAFYACGVLEDIFFGGTVIQWNDIPKGSNWNYHVPATCVVHCTDGDYDISGNPVQSK